MQDIQTQKQKSESEGKCLFSIPLGRVVQYAKQGRFIPKSEITYTQHYKAYTIIVNSTQSQLLWGTTSRSRVFID